MSAQNNTAAPSVVQLEFPITLADGATLSELKLRRLTVGEIKHLNPNALGGSTGIVLAYVAIMNDLPIAEMDKLDAVDMTEVMEKVSPFVVKASLLAAMLERSQHSSP